MTDRPPKQPDPLENPGTAANDSDEEQGTPDVWFRRGYQMLCKAHDDRQKEEAAFWFRAAAEAGHAAAANNLGTLYEHGNGLPRDLALAERWYRLAAETGLPAAQFNLGFLLQNHRADGEATREALTWYEKAAAGGEITAKSNLAVMLARGEGAEANFERAVSLWKEAARAGEPLAAFNLGVAHAGGHTGEIDFGRAWIYFERAEALGHQEASKRRAALQDVLSPAERAFVARVHRVQRALDTNGHSLG